MYLFLGVALSTSTSVSSFGNSLVDFFETLVILSAILLPIKSPVAFAVFWIALFDAVFMQFYPYPFTYISWFNWISHFYNLHLITIVKFILSSISNGWLFWSVNHTSMSWNSELNVFRNIWFVREISNKLPNGLFGTNVYNSWILLIIISNNITMN